MSDLQENVAKAISLEWIGEDDGECFLDEAKAAINTVLTELLSDEVVEAVYHTDMNTVYHPLMDIRARYRNILTAAAAKLRGEG